MKARPSRMSRSGCLSDGAGSGSRTLTRLRLNTDMAKPKAFSSTANGAVSHWINRPATPGAIRREAESVAAILDWASIRASRPIRKVRKIWSAPPPMTEQVPRTKAVVHPVDRQDAEPVGHGDAGQREALDRF